MLEIISSSDNIITMPIQAHQVLFFVCIRPASLTVNLLQIAICFLDVLSNYVTAKVSIAGLMKFMHENGYDSDALIDDMENDNTSNLCIYGYANNYNNCIVKFKEYIEHYQCYVNIYFCNLH